jgi:hypothetical protein
MLLMVIISGIALVLLVQGIVRAWSDSKVISVNAGILQPLQDKLEMPQTSPLVLQRILRHSL